MEENRKQFERWRERKGTEKKGKRPQIKKKEINITSKMRKKINSNTGR